MQKFAQRGIGRAVKFLTWHYVLPIFCESVETMLPRVASSCLVEVYRDRMSMVFSGRVLFSRHCLASSYAHAIYSCRHVANQHCSSMVRGRDLIFCDHSPFRHHVFSRRRPSHPVTQCLFFVTFTHYLLLWYILDFSALFAFPWL